MTFGQFIKQKRQQSKFSQQRLADACGFAHRSAILRLEQDALEWKLKEVVSIAELFGLSASQLLAEYENFIVSFERIPKMTPQERSNRNSLEAVAQLVDLCFTKNADQIAEMEAQLFLMGFHKLADIVRLQGLNNAGSEYPPIFFKTLQAKFEG